MKTNRGLSFFSSSVLGLGLTLGLTAVVSTGCAADTDDDATNSDESEVVVDSSEAAVSGTQTNFGYFIVTRVDTRKCAAPLCGGYFVKRVNEATTACADGSKQAECYVSSIELGGIGLSAREGFNFLESLKSGKALIKAKTYKKKVSGKTVGVLKANEGWLGATGATPDGSFYRAADNGIRCVKAPCPSTTAFQLNGHDDHNIIDVVLDHTTPAADESDIFRAKQAINTAEGTLVAGGIMLPKCTVPVAADCGPKLSASEFYFKVSRTEGNSCGGFTRTPTYCNDGQFCSWKEGDICGAADAPGKCAYRPDMCPALYNPVCGCDGQTYSNSCAAGAAGVSVSASGACANR